MINVKILEVNTLSFDDCDTSLLVSNVDLV